MSAEKRNESIEKILKILEGKSLNDVEEIIDFVKKSINNEFLLVREPQNKTL